MGKVLYMAPFHPLQSPQLEKKLRMAVEETAGFGIV